MKFHILESTHAKHLRSAEYNYDFCKRTGHFARWGAELKDDPDWSPVGCEIADIEISTICHQGCRFCYKDNRSTGRNMSLDTFKQILAKLPKTCTQIAFGTGSLTANPDVWDILRHCRAEGVIPNITINGSLMQPEHYQWLTDVCGAVAVSRYDADTCYEAVRQLSSAGLQQTNIHQLLSEETFEDCLQVIQDAQQDDRLRGLRAIVFLALKPIGRGTRMTPLRSMDQYGQLVAAALESGVGFGFDSCSAPMFLKAIEHHAEYERFVQLAEPCESTLFSIYIDVNARAFPCSFLESDFEGVDVLAAEDFLRDVWRAPSIVRWRTKLLNTVVGGLVNGCRQCPAFDIYPEVANKAPEPVVRRRVLGQIQETR
ncbi:hypothetical protein LCGC14_0827950 [marine sediment metagenome]|uniref:Radical SAM core domain-containing protein n=1 Tax=marine sediment metagenome TaxID=412755 RepID=A0A0F9PGT9_9ZZZZ